MSAGSKGPCEQPGAGGDRGEGRLGTDRSSDTTQVEGCVGGWGRRSWVTPDCMGLHWVAKQPLFPLCSLNKAGIGGTWAPDGLVWAKVVTPVFTVLPCGLKGTVAFPTKAGRAATLNTQTASTAVPVGCAVRTTGVSVAPCPRIGQPAIHLGEIRQPP